MLHVRELIALTPAVSRERFIHAIWMLAQGAAFDVQMNSRLSIPEVLKWRAHDWRTQWNGVSAHLCVRHFASVADNSKMLRRSKGGLAGDYKRSQVASGLLLDSSPRQSRTSGPACPLPSGSPQWHGAPQGWECAAYRQRWAAGHRGPDAPVAAQCPFSLRDRRMESCHKLNKYFRTYSLYSL